MDANCPEVAKIAPSQFPTERESQKRARPSVQVRVKPGSEGQGGPQTGGRGGGGGGGGRILTAAVGTPEMETSKCLRRRRHICQIVKVCTHARARTLSK